ncbi:hypothetical protein [Clostridium sp. DJ247]|uniref:hypothetical protein n=1 Tax=Clostridium sp. DJ247 TaxID=2726188 RepID=UPI001623593E|nr:hypothetical protein [Clostridium sp. DJ247]MBC2580422.1 hypothetical protein [Clostridium sp. DJ247]
MDGYLGVYGFIYPLLVITGLHHSMLPVDLQIISNTGSSFVFQIVAFGNIAQVSKGKIVYCKHNVKRYIFTTQLVYVKILTK